MLANKGFAHCAVVRLQARLNLLDPTVFRLPVQLSAPPLKALCSTVSKHKAQGTEPTPQSVSQTCLNTPLPVQSQGHSALLKAASNNSKTRDNKDARNNENGALEQQATLPCASTKVSDDASQQAHECPTGAQCVDLVGLARYVSLFQCFGHSFSIYKRVIVLRPTILTTLKWLAGWLAGWWYVIPNTSH